MEKFSVFFFLFFVFNESVRVRIERKIWDKRKVSLNNASFFF